MVVRYSAICINCLEDVSSAGKETSSKRTSFFQQAANTEQAEMYPWLRNPFLPRGSLAGVNEWLFLTKLEKESEREETVSFVI